MYSSMKKESFSNPFQNESRNPSTNKESFIREWKGHGLTRRAGSSRPRNIISILFPPPPKKKLSPVEGMHALQIRCTVVLVKTENGREEQKLFPWPYARPIATPSCTPTIDENLRFSFPSGPFEIVAFRIFLSLSLALSLSRVLQHRYRYFLSISLRKNHSTHALRDEFLCSPEVRGHCFLRPFPSSLPFPSSSRENGSRFETIKWFRDIEQRDISFLLLSALPIFCTGYGSHIHFMIREYEIYIYIYIYTRTKFRVE